MNTGMPNTVRAKKSIPVGPACGHMRRSTSGRRPHLTRKQLDELQRSLLTRRDELIADMLQLDSELLNVQADQDKSDELECSSESEEAEVVVRMLQAGYSELREINGALDRMNDGTYGICPATGVPIGIERLRARPWAMYCIEYARTLEKSRPRKVAG